LERLARVAVLLGDGDARLARELDVYELLLVLLLVPTQD